MKNTPKEPPDSPDCPLFPKPVHIGCFSLICTFFVVIAFRYEEPTDDVFIFLRYAQHFAEGHGLVWNIGERVEGYTSLLWVLVLSFLFLMTSEVEVWVSAVTIFLGVCSLFLVYRLATRLATSPWAGCMAAGLLASDRSFTVWSATGMDTRLFCFLTLALVSLAHWMAPRKSSQRDGMILGLVMLLLSLTRPEGIALSFIWFVFLALNRPKWYRDPTVLMAGSLWFFGVACHFAWRYGYYGLPLPNTFYAKVTGFNFAIGVEYFQWFVTSHSLQVVVVSICLGRILMRWRADRFQSLLAATILGYSFYILAIGGEIMEFRLLDLVIVLSVLLVSISLFDFSRSLSSWRSHFLIGMTTILLAANVGTAINLERRFHADNAKWSHRPDPYGDCITIGKWFKKIALPGESIAVGTAGAIPYYSGLPCIDTLGLNDRYIASLPPVENASFIGHQKRAPDSYLWKNGMTYVIDNALPLEFVERPLKRPQSFIMEVENMDREDGEEESFYIQLRTMWHRDTLIESLRQRGVNAF